MQFLMNLIVAVQLISALSIIGLVLLQQGKGAAAGAWELQRRRAQTVRPSMLSIRSSSLSGLKALVR